MHFSAFLTLLLCMAPNPYVSAVTNAAHSDAPAKRHMPASRPANLSDQTEYSATTPPGDITVSFQNLPGSEEGLLKTWENSAPLMAAFLALIAVVVSITAYILLPVRMRRSEIRLAYVESQLSKLYGPLLAECINSDSIFRKSEQVIQTRLDANSHHHLRSIETITSDLLKLVKSKDADQTTKDPDRLFAWALINLYLPSNQRRVDLLKENIHLYGPYPPLSFYLFLTHAAQLQSLIDLKEHIDIMAETKPATPNADLDPLDPYSIYPFPTILTAEVIAKVAFLKALQREYQLNMGKLIKRKEIFYRNPYFLALQFPSNLPVRTDFCECCAASLSRLRRKPPLRKHVNELAKKDLCFPTTLPLIWGPYTGVELMEMRSWLITKEIPMRKMNRLPEQGGFMDAVLNAAVITVSTDKGYGDLRLPLHYRVAQAFDSIDQSGGKAVSWNPQFLWSDLEQDESAELEADFLLYRRSDNPDCITTMKDLTKTLGFAYRPGFSRLFDSRQNLFQSF